MDHVLKEAKKKGCTAGGKGCVCSAVGDYASSPGCSNGGPKVHCGNCIKDYQTHPLCQCKETVNSFERQIECDPRPLTEGQTITELYEEVMKYRVSKKTGYNPESSRGHLILTLDVKKSDQQETCKYTITDLAGFETPEKAATTEKKVKNTVRQKWERSDADEKIFQEGTAIVGGIQKVGEAIGAFGDDSKKQPKHPLLSLMGYDKPDEIEKFAFIACVNECGLPSGRIRDSMRALETGQQAMKERPEAEMPKCSPCVPEQGRRDIARNKYWEGDPAGDACKCICRKRNRTTGEWIDPPYVGNTCENPPSHINRKP